MEFPLLSLHLSVLVFIHRIVHLSNLSLPEIIMLETTINPINISTSRPAPVPLSPYISVLSKIMTHYLTSAMSLFSFPLFLIIHNILTTTIVGIYTANCIVIASPPTEPNYILDVVNYLIDHVFHV